jgi:hypothetical protein
MSSILSLLMALTVMFLFLFTVTRSRLSSRTTASRTGVLLMPNSEESLSMERTLPGTSSLLMIFSLR